MLAHSCLTSAGFCLYLIPVKSVHSITVLTFLNPAESELGRRPGFSGQKMNEEDNGLSRDSDSCHQRPYGYA